MSKPKRGKRDDVPWTKEEREAAEAREEAWEAICQVATKLGALSSYYFDRTGYKVAYPLRVLWTMLTNRQPEGLTEEALDLLSPPWIGVAAGSFHPALKYLQSAGLVVANGDRWKLSTDPVARQLMQFLFTIKDLRERMIYLDECRVKGRTGVRPGSDQAIPPEVAVITLEPPTEEALWIIDGTDADSVPPDASLDDPDDES